MFQSWDSCLDSVNQVPTLGCIPIAFKNVISAMLLFVGLVALIMIMYAGVTFVTSKGDPKRVEGAKHTMTFAIIGLVIVLLSFAVIIFIGYITNSGDCLNTINDPAKFLQGC